jgi:hypothetical protein
VRSLIVDGVVGSAAPTGDLWAALSALLGLTGWDAAALALYPVFFGAGFALGVWARREQAR